MPYVVGFLYTFLCTILYFQFVYHGKISVFVILTVPLAFFLPLLIGLVAQHVNMKKLNATLVVAFILGLSILEAYDVYSVGVTSWDYLKWAPIVIVGWVAFSFPAIALLNILCIARRKIAV